MKTSNIKAQVTKSRGKFMRVTVQNSKGEISFVGKIKKMGEKFVTFSKFSGKKEELKFHINSIKGLA